MSDDQTQTADFAEAWKPEPGDTVKGTLKRVTMSPDFGYGPYPILVLQTSEGERSVHSYHHVLRTELARRRPVKGDELEITYLGKRDSRSGSNSFHAYAVEGGNEPDFNWDNELPETERGAYQSADPPIPPRAPDPVSPPDPADEDIPF